MPGNYNVSITEFVSWFTEKWQYPAFWAGCNVLLFALPGLILWLAKLPVEYFSNWFQAMMIPYAIVIYVLKKAAAATGE